MAKLAKVQILDIYPELFSLNGDKGNVLALQRRLEWAGIPVELVSVSAGTDLSQFEPNFVHLGGGTVAAQQAGIEQLVPFSELFKTWQTSGVGIVAVAGGFQLAAEQIVFPGNTTPEPGLGLFSGISKEVKQRTPGFVLLETTLWGEVFGYENLGQSVELDFSEHTAQTPFANSVKVESGSTQPINLGAHKFVTLGVQLNGPLLPRNPKLTDWLISTVFEKQNSALLERYQLNEKHQQADFFAAQANQQIKTKF